MLNVNIIVQNEVAYPLYWHCQLVYAGGMLHRHSSNLDSSLCNWKSTFLRPLSGWNLSYEDIKSKDISTDACDATKAP